MQFLHRVLCEFRDVDRDATENFFVRLSMLILNKMSNVVVRWLSDWYFLFNYLCNYNYHYVNTVR